LRAALLVGTWTRDAAGGRQQPALVLPVQVVTLRAVDSSARSNFDCFERLGALYLSVMSLLEQYTGQARLSEGDFFSRRIGN
jgi:hypothetical protein